VPSCWILICKIWSEQAYILWIDLIYFILEGRGGSYGFTNLAYSDTDDAYLYIAEITADLELDFSSFILISSNWVTTTNFVISWYSGQDYRKSMGTQPKEKDKKVKSLQDRNLKDLIKAMVPFFSFHGP
jgi:hypothetical protein